MTGNGTHNLVMDEMMLQLIEPPGQGSQILILSDLPPGLLGIQTWAPQRHWYKVTHAKDRKNVRKGVEKEGWDME